MCLTIHSVIALALWVVFPFLLVIIFFTKGSYMFSTILISALVALIVSLIVHWFFMTQLTKWIDDFFDREDKTFKKYAEDITEIVRKNL
ncbi:hypothetical protein [Pelistega ratti]|uniref:hypothetical protein n=1 Tax=Pelistega ratti TaxID=2652177 RepID=UPI00135BE4BA|nr:hypothetical protein [Pelistega ratti]